MSIAFNFHNNVLTVIVGGKVYNINQDDVRFNQVKSALKDSDEEQLIRCLDVKNTVKNYVAKYCQEAIYTSDDKVIYKGVELHNVIVDKIKQFAKDGLPFEHLLKFIENISLNPSYRAQQELFKFLENKYLPITEDGCFYAYKSVRNDWMDIYSGTISNQIGNTITMDRGKVDDNKDRGCSKGLHCGAIEYVNTYGSDDKHIIIVKVNPKDVVSVPDDCSCQKIRVCEYYCHSEYVKPLDKPLYSNVITYIDDYYANSDDWDEYDDLDDDDDDDWEDDEQWIYDEEDDDNLTAEDVTVKCNCNCGCDDDSTPSYHNKRGADGRFIKK
jgi:hypothetical protein